VTKIVKELVKKGKVVAGICSGISLLYSAGVLENKFSKKYSEGLPEITACDEENVWRH